MPTDTHKQNHTLIYCKCDCNQILYTKVQWPTCARPHSCTCSSEARICPWNIRQCLHICVLRLEPFAPDPHIPTHVPPQLGLASCHPPFSPPAEWYMRDLRRLYSPVAYLKCSERGMRYGGFYLRRLLWLRGSCGTLTIMALLMALMWNVFSR